MKKPTNLFIFIMLFAVTGITFAQRSTSKSVKYETISIPTVPIADFETLSLKMYFPNGSVTQDTLRKYAGNMDILKTDEERLSGTKYFSIKPTNMVNEGADMQVEVAFGAPIFHHKDFQETPGTLYWVEHELPTKVKIMDRNGKVLEYWTEPGRNTIQFGGEQIEYATKSAGGTTFTIRHLSYTEYDLLGEMMVNKKAVMYQMKKVIESLYDRMYFVKKKHKFDVASAKGKNYDYTALDQAQDNALDAIKVENYAMLANSIEVWKEHLAQASEFDRKAMINPNIASGLAGNIAIAYFLMDDMEAATTAAETYQTYSERSSQKKTVNGRTQAEVLYDLVNRTAKAKLANGTVSIPAKTEKAFDVKRKIGRKRKNKELDYFFNEDVYDTFYVEASNEIEDQANEPISEVSTGRDYKASVMTTSTQGVMLIMDFLRFSEDVGQPFPEEVTQITELEQVLAGGMRFTELPESIGNLVNLNKLVLRGSNLETLPESIGNLSALKRLDLSNNKLTSIPESIKNCNNLKSLNLKGNKISADELDKLKQRLPATCKLKI